MEIVTGPVYRKRLARLQKLCDAQHNQCAACWCYMVMELGRENTATIDHIIPTSKGGRPTSITNTQVLCWTCNNKKGDKTP